MKRHNYGESFEKEEPAKEETEEQETEWEWEEDPLQEKIRKQKGKSEESSRASRWRRGGKKKNR